MKLRLLTCLAAAAGLFVLAGAKPAHKLSKAKSLPKGLSKKVSAVVDPDGFVIEGAGGAIARIWLAKELQVKAGFSPTLEVNYPLTTGQFIGVLEVTGKSTYTDFRGQEIAKGVFTLRYGHQPMDGNHIGTSELRDFLMALPARMDTDPQQVKNIEMLHKRSAKSAGSTHPAIYSLLPAKKPTKTSLSHDDDNELWILNVTARGKANGKAVKLPMRIVVIGKSE